MSPTPTGRLVRTPDGRDLVLPRTFRAPIEDVWASLTEPERTARWFGPWTGDAGVGNTIQVTMAFEQEAPPIPMTIRACEPPRHLHLYAADEHGTWDIEAILSEADGVTTLEFVHHLDDRTDPGSTGPGWEYYLDLLVSSREGLPAADFSAYYPAQKAHYEALAAAL